jgi:hypothetical protein
MKHNFEYADGRIYLVTTIQVWGGDVVERTDVTEKLMDSGVVDDYLDHKLGLDDYKRIDGVTTYVGKDKDKYNK